MDTELDQPTVVVGIDGSAGSRNALAAAVRSASWRGARVRAVTVFEPFEVWSPWPHYVPAAGIGLPDPARIEGEDTEAVHGLVSEVLASNAPRVRRRTRGGR